MEVTDIGLGVLEIIPRRHADARGSFAETWQRNRFAQAGVPQDWMQDNQSFTAERGVIRGLHLQLPPFAQAKLIRVVSGAIFDVAVDARPGSVTFGTWVARRLSADRFNQLLIPAGFAHGFMTLEDAVTVHYKVDAPYAPEAERAIAWNDPELAIAWPLEPSQQPLLSARDAAAPLLSVVVPELRARVRA
ncbi:MAG: dTDP-4-dehydrorhamnose 3,5-epimerase [Rhizobiales bacterium]|nr:dTDP-4-dehydrorhamnose 3,5-epimerase [Hyphomicrobiales bacterium]